MKQKNLWLMCGVPASGKSTYVHDAIRAHGGTYISRDEVRFSITGEDEDYFSHENEVFQEFIKQINNALDFYKDVYIDATHLNQASRNKVLDRVNLAEVNIIPVNFMTPVEVCIARNSNRTGRACVPENVIKRMASQFRPARDGEKYEYDSIVDVIYEGGMTVK